MKRLSLVAITLVLACNALPLALPLTAPTTSPVVGGISDVRPFFGELKDANAQKAGDFLLATCGCGDWRVLLQMTDGTQYQYPVHFYADGEYVPQGTVEVYGTDGDKATLGVIDQDAGTVSGDMNLNNLRRTFAATRGDSHSLEIQACVLCHIGDNPIHPRPPTHAPYLPGVTNCFDCHQVNIQ